MPNIILKLAFTATASSTNDPNKTPNEISFNCEAESILYKGIYNSFAECLSKQIVKQE